MLEQQFDNQVPEGLGGVAVDNVVDSEEYSSDESVTAVIEDDEDLTTDGCRGRSGQVLDAAQEVPTFGNVCVNNSSDIHFGNKTVYQGPVTIKQFVYANSNVEEAVDNTLPDGLKTEMPLASSRFIAVEHQPVTSKDTRDQLKLCLDRATKRRRWIAWILVISVAVVASVVTFVAVFTSDDRGTTTKASFNTEPDDEPPFESKPHEHTLSPVLRILQRRDWLAEPAREKIDTLTLPVPYVIISHTATENCSSQAQCVHTVRTVQTFHIESKNWSDIAYNFVVGGDGYVYTGRGWGGVGAHAYGYNRCSIGISLLGTFVKNIPPPQQMSATKQLIEMGVKLRKIRPDYMLLGHRQVSATESPGEALFNEIKTFPHWRKDPVSCDVAIRQTKAIPPT